MIGQTILHYRILEKLGEGGMGVVYKAEDTKLDRTVALKFLPPHLQAGVQEKARFVQEAKSAAALTHPNICSVIDIGEAEGQLFIVMEFVDGQTLRQKLGSLTHRQAVDIGIQVAEGLAAAHEKGIVHRDIKPENIMIRRDGIAQIMDFGLAKLRGTVTRLTKEGSTVGTAGYMSPEQIQGQDADHRSDIFSLGVLLYELLTGQMPFRGVHETALAYEIVNVDPAPMASVKGEIDPGLDAVVLECLEKDPRERTQSAAQVALDLKRHRRESSRQRASRITAARPAPQAPGGLRPSGMAAAARAPQRLPWIIAGICCAAALVLGYLALWPRPARTNLTSASLLPPERVNFCLYGNTAGPAAISPDGTRLAFVGTDSAGKRHLYVRALDAGEAALLEGTDGALHPFWSPDNRHLAFFADDKMKQIDASGGAPITICDAGFPRGGTWNSDGTIVFAPGVGGALFAVAAAGGTPTRVTTLDSLQKENSHRWPSFLPDGKHFLYLARAVAAGDQAEGGLIRLGSLDGSVNKVLVRTVSNPVYAAGYVLYTRGATLLAHRFDERSMELAGDPVAIADKVTYDPSTNRSMFTVSSTGLLVYQTGTARLGSRFIFYDRNGTRLPRAVEMAEYFYPRLSPDGTRVSYYLWDTRSHNADVWVYDFGRQMKTRMTFGAASENYSAWSPDGSRIVFNSNRDGRADLYVRSAAGTGAEELLLKTDRDKRPCDWSPDGKTLMYQEDGGGKTGSDLWLLPLSGDRTPAPFLLTEFNEEQARFSPDGRWVAYVSDESGKKEIYIRASGGGQGGKWQVSTDGGDTPCWRRDGKELFYCSTDRHIMAADIAAGAGAVDINHVRALFEVPSIVQLPVSDYDVTPDGKQFLINVPFETQNQTPLTIVVNWEHKLEKK